MSYYCHKCGKVIEEDTAQYCFSCQKIKNSECALFCQHANECPSGPCDCPEDCYCKIKGSCKKSPLQIDKEYHRYVWARIEACRKTPIHISYRYRPDILIDGNYLGIYFMDGENEHGEKTIEFGEKARVQLGFLYRSEDKENGIVGNSGLMYDLLKSGVSFKIVEGSTVVATGVVE